MDVWEKLVELLGVITCPNNICNFCEHFQNKSACERHKKEVIADHLIANGVTVQEWIPVTERLPDEGVPVLIYCWHDEAVEESWLQDGSWGGRFNFHYMSEVSHWMPLPEPPKEDV